MIREHVETAAPTLEITLASRHVHALRSPGQTAGYDPPTDDPLLNHTFGRHWVQMTLA